MRRERIFAMLAVLIAASGCATRGQMDQFSQELDVVKALQKNLEEKQRADVKELRAELQKLRRDIKKQGEREKNLRIEFKNKVEEMKSLLNEKTSQISRLKSDLELKNKAIKSLSKEKADTEISLRNKLREQKEQFEKRIRQLEAAARKTATQPAAKTEKAK